MSEKRTLSQPPYDVGEKVPMTLVSEKRGSENESQTAPAPKPTAHRAATVVQVVSWAIMIMFSLVFLGLGVAALASNNHPVPKRNSLQQATKVAVSMWPIVFAAIMAQTLRAYGAWKVERGIPLVTLEQLISSHSMGAAIKQPFLLRKFNLTSVALLVIWVLSPLASQALVRLINTKETELGITGKVQYVQMQQWPYSQTEFISSMDVETGDGYLRETVYGASLIGSSTARKGNQDLWANPKIPFYTTANATTNQNGTEWSSLIGVPIALPPAAKTVPGYTAGWQFNLITPYYRLNCSDVVNLNLSSPLTPAYNFSTGINSSDTGTLFFNVANDTTLTEPVISHQSTPLEHPGPGEAGTIYWGSKDGTWQNRNSELLDFGAVYIWFSQCSYWQELTNTTVSCTGTGTDASCEIQDQSLVPSNASTFQPLGTNFAAAMMASAKTAGTAWTDTENYIYNPDFAGLAETSTSTTLQNNPDGFMNFSGATLSLRLGQLVNTMWAAGHDPRVFLGGNLTDTWNSTTSGGTIGGTWVPGTADALATGALQTRYDVSVVWAVVLIVCSLVLVFAAVAAAVLEHRTVGPEFLGFANTAVRKGVKLPAHMSALSARDRLNALQECEILLQDVRPGANVGKMALGVKDETSVPLKHGRQYR
ncbi:hypothetical protein ANO11243_092450 [Dothideomycetidae sp. 11243]|nr:hypothetical protein ANO11243_092450 [fungal sp. No.11243]